MQSINLMVQSDKSKTANLTYHWISVSGPGVFTLNSVHKLMQINQEMESALLNKVEC